MSDNGAARRGLERLEQQAQKLQAHEYKIDNLRRSCEKMEPVRPAQDIGSTIKIQAAVTSLVKLTKVRAASYRKVPTTLENPKQDFSPAPKTDHESFVADLGTIGLYLIRKSISQISNWLR